MGLPQLLSQFQVDFSHIHRLLQLPTKPNTNTYIMKFSTATVLLACASGASAFTSPSMSHKTNFALRMAEGEESPLESVTMALESVSAEDVAVETPKGKSQSLPFMDRPAALDGSMVGDVGFDPLGFAKTEADLFNYREAEIKHGRLAMLAAAGWPISELFDQKLANLIGAPAVVDATDRAPSVLNGGLGKISPVYWVACLAAAGAIDLIQNDKAAKNGPEYTFAGNLGFDPLGLYPKDEAGQKRMQLAELKNGRLGMIAITAFAFQEFVSSVGVVNETPIFFKPLGEVLHAQANAGYYIPN